MVMMGRVKKILIMTINYCHLTFHLFIYHCRFSSKLISCQTGQRHQINFDLSSQTSGILHKFISEIKLSQDYCCCNYFQIYFRLFPWVIHEGNVLGCVVNSFYQKVFVCENKENPLSWKFQEVLLRVQQGVLNE